MKKYFLSVLCLFLALSSLTLAQEIVQTPDIPKLVSPEISGSDVTFRFYGEYMTEVLLDGSWLAYPVPMQKNNGVWELTVTGVPSDICSYTFLADGVRVADPSNPLVMKDGRDAYSMLVTDVSRPGNYRRSTRRGTVDYVWYSSKLMGEQRRMAVYTPYGYETNLTKKYPVLYLLHGENGDEESWLSIGRLASTLDNLISDGRAVPMIVVMPDCRPDKEGRDMFATSLVSELIPFVESRYRAIRTKAGRGIAGNSYGGTQVVNVVRLHPELFDFVCPLSFILEDDGKMKDDFLRIKNAKVTLLWMGCGTGDTLSHDCCDHLHVMLNDIHLLHTFYQNVGGHDWTSWRLYLNNFLPMIFRYYQ